MAPPLALVWEQLMEQVMGLPPIARAFGEARFYGNSSEGTMMIAATTSEGELQRCPISTKLTPAYTGNAF